MMRFGMINHLRRRAGHLAYNSFLYNWSLGGTIPEDLAFVPVDNFPGDAEKGRWLCSGAFAVNGEHLEIRGDCWEPVGVGAAWLSHMHSFEWLRDLRALGGDKGRQQARALVSSWIQHYGRWDAEVWCPELTGRRVASWIISYDFFGASADDDFQDDFFASLARQSRHLSRALPGAYESLPLLYGARGLAFAGLALAGRESWLEQGLDILEDQIRKQILSDGGHVSRSPSQLFEAFCIITDIRTALISGHYPVPEEIEHVIDRMAQALRFFRYPDKHMAVFNGAQEGDGDLMERFLSRQNARGRILRSLPHTGYERATVGRSLLMVDTAAPPAWPYDDKSHAAPLAFEFMYGKERVFVNCGTHPLEAEWQDVLRGTAAHNAVCMDYRNICEIRKDGHFGRKPRHVVVTREDHEGTVLIEGSHDGYLPLGGITHRRKLYLARGGHDLRGEEQLSCSVGLGKPADIAVRFHLHPNVKVSLIREGREALLRLSGGAGWRFFNQGGELSLENSIYLGTGSRPRKTKQLVIHGRMESDFAKIKWALQREIK